MKTKDSGKESGSEGWNQGTKKICEAKYEQSMLIKLTKACKSLLFINLK